MNGMEMLMRSFGLKPEEIKETVGQFAQTFKLLQEQMNRIEAKLDQALAQPKEKTDGPEEA